MSEPSMTPDQEAPVVLSVDGHAATITMNRPKRMNALDRDVLEALRDAIVAVGQQPDVRVAIVTGAGRAFVAGADIVAMKNMSEDEATEFARFGQEIFASIEALRFPVIAAVNGFALGGGCELALACDFIYASADAKLGQPEVTLGVTPGFGGTQRLLRRVGIGHARELIYTGEVITAERALAIGLVNQVVPADELMAFVAKKAAAIASVGPVAVAECKAVLRDGANRSLSDGNALEAKAFGRCFRSADQREGMSAFLEKRRASFTGE